MKAIATWMGRLVLGLVGIAVLGALAIAVAVSTSPRPFAALVKRQFATGVGIPLVQPPLYGELSRQARVERDIEYPSTLGDNRLDVFSPASATGPTMTILWVHGGGFVGGDKSGVDTWATLVAARGYTIVSINYALAPGTPYPGPLVQLAQAHEFLRTAGARFPTVDLHRLVVGGDSAGAQVAAQFIALQLSPSLQQSMRSAAVLARADLLGAVLYCGPYNLRGLYDAPGRFGRFFIRQLGWAYFGIRDWKDSPQAIEASVTAQVTADYPPAFITDGNTGSFESDARQLEAALHSKGVRTDSLYFPREQGALGHEYQFDYSLPQAMQAYERTLQFLASLHTTPR